MNPTFHDLADHYDNRTPGDDDPPDCPTCEGGGEVYRKIGKRGRALVDAARKVRAYNLANPTIPQELHNALDDAIRDFILIDCPDCGGSGSQEPRDYDPD